MCHLKFLEVVYTAKYLMSHQKNNFHRLWSDAYLHHIIKTNSFLENTSYTNTILV